MVYCNASNTAWSPLYVIASYSLRPTPLKSSAWQSSHPFLSFASASRPTQCIRTSQFLTVTESSSRRARWVAILTGAVTVLIGVLYLGLITILDVRGPLQPPPPEALLDVANVLVKTGDIFAWSVTVRQPGAQLS